MLSYTHFTLSEREYLQELLSKDMSLRKIAAQLGRATSSISREIARNRTNGKPKKESDNKYQYHHWRANILATCRSRTKKYQALMPDTDEWNYIIKGLKQYWSPECIAATWHKQYPNRKRLSVSTIYRYIRKKKFPDITEKKNLRRRGKRHMPKNSKYITIHPDRIIPEWPEEIRQRERIGDWEGDTVYGGIGKGLLVTQVDRKSRYLCAGLLAKRDALLTKEVICQLLKGLPVKSISLDNGAEFAEFHQVESELETVVYFAEPHKPWQRGTNENTNDILRFFFPKGCDFTQVTQEYLDYVVQLINNRPRKCLGWKTPAEVFWGG